MNGLFVLATIERQLISSTVTKLYDVGPLFKLSETAKAARASIRMLHRCEGEGICVPASCIDSHLSGHRREEVDVMLVLVFGFWE